MFRTLYRCGRTVARHENGPAARSRLAYLEYLAEGGSTLHCLRANAGVLYRAAVCMNLDDTSLVERAAVEKAATEWAHRKFLNAMASSPEPTEKEFRYITCRWLRFAGRLQEPTRPPSPHQAELDAYCRYMTEERGLAHSPQVYASWGNAGRCDDADSGKRRRWNWSNSSRIDHRNSGSF